jgi:hypothetical protein
VTNTLAYYNTATITAVKSLKVWAADYFAAVSLTHKEKSL